MGFTLVMDIMAEMLCRDRNVGVKADTEPRYSAPTPLAERVSITSAGFKAKVKFDIY
jgi:hypothetical protein